MTSSTACCRSARMSAGAAARSRAPSEVFARLYSFYFDRVAPAIAALLGGDRDAYRYLPRSLRPFPDPDRLAAMLRDAGFRAVTYERLSFGIAAIHIAEV